MPKLSERDRIQAILRHPQYLKDYDYVQKLKTDAPKIEINMPLSRGLLSPRPSDDELKVHQVWEEEQKICIKWGLLYLVNSQAINPSYALPANPVVVISDEVFEIRPKTTTEWRYSVVKPKVKKKSRKEFKRLLEEICKKENIVADLKEGRYLTLQIDLWAGRDKTKQEIGKRFDLYRRYVSPPRGKIKESTQALWRVYDAHHQEGKPLLQIAKETCGFKENPTYNAKARSRYMQIYRAYNKALKMIKQVTPST